MGTRGFMGFVSNGIEKLTYNHFDSYPDGLGTQILDWARHADLDAARPLVDSLRMVQDHDTPSVADQVAHAASHEEVSTGKDWYALLRAHQGDIGATLAAGVMIDSSGFPYDSLFAEWGYLIDFDEETFEVYRGFQESAPRAGRWATPERIAHEQEMYGTQVTGVRYHAVALCAVWSLRHLPTEEEFLLTFAQGDDDLKGY